VTRLGEFSLVETFLSLDNFMKGTSIEQIFGQEFSLKKVALLSLSKYSLGHFLGDFFKKASGHPDSYVHIGTRFTKTQTIKTVKLFICLRLILSIEI
jgi:hypothetical protein